MEEMIVTEKDVDFARLIEDEEYKKSFVKKEVKRIQDAQVDTSIELNERAELFCPYCGKETLEVYMGNPFFFSCTECDKTIFMTDKKIFNDMCKELEETYEKEKEEAIKEALSKGR